MTRQAADPPKRGTGGMPGTGGEPRTGMELDGRYRLEGLVARGGMGEVWRARDGLLGRLVAVKLLRRDLAADPEVRERFRDEARHTAALAHPGIAAVHDYADSGGAAYLVLELVDGLPLSAVLAETGPLGVERTLDVVAQTATALQAAHDAGVVHRDVKPGNLLLRPDGTVVVTDFGIARAAQATATRTAVGTVIGTADYLAPEISRGSAASPASDVYALGVVAYECLSGRRPFVGTDPVAVAGAHLHDVPPPLPAEVPQDVTRFVLSCLAKDPGRRPPTAAEVARQAAALRTAHAAPATAVLPLGDAARGAAGGAAGVGAAGVGAAGLAGAAGVGAAGVAAAGVAGAAVPAAVPLEASADPAARPSWRTNQPGQRRTRVGMALTGSAAVLLGFLVLRACATEPSPRSTAGAARPAAPGAPPATAADPVQVDLAAYVGRPRREVVRRLRTLGLVPRVTYRTDPSAPADTVVAVQPGGAVARGSTVTVTVAAAPAGGDGEGDGGDGD